jgi:hypothetical protein
MKVETLITRDTVTISLFDFACHIREFRPLNFYSVITRPMKVSGQQGFITQLTNVPKYFVSSLAQDLGGEILEVPSFPVVEMYEV